MQISSSAEEHAMMAESWRRTLSSTLERRVGPRMIALPADLSPAMVWNPSQAVNLVAPTRDRFVRSATDPGPLPTDDDQIAFAPVTSLSRWIERKQLTSTRLTQIYLDRIAKHDGKLRCIITLTKDRALSRAMAADAEIAAGKYRGPLHGIPFGVKDLLDTAGIDDIRRRALSGSSSDTRLGGRQTSRRCGCHSHREAESWCTRIE